MTRPAFRFRFRHRLLPAWARAFPHGPGARFPARRIPRALPALSSLSALPILLALLVGHAPPLSAQDLPDEAVDPAYPAFEAAPEPVAPLPPDVSATLLLARARDHHHGGAFTAEVLCVRESYLGGRDTLRGVLQAGPAPGERRLSLRGATDGFEWWSRGDGAEQWGRTGLSGRLRRLAPYSLKKPSFSPDISYEDLARLPFGYLDASRGARKARENDSAVTLQLAPGGALATLYASLEATIGRRDALLRKMEFTGNGTRPSRTMRVGRYVSTPEGAFPTEIVFASTDGLTATRLYLTLLNREAARDKADAGGQGMGPRFAEPLWESRPAVPRSR